MRNKDSTFVLEYDLKTSFVHSAMPQDALERLHLRIERGQTVLGLLNKLPHHYGIPAVGGGVLKVFNVEVSSISVKSIHEITHVSDNP